MRLIAGCQDYIHGGTQKDEYTEEDVQTVPCPLCGGEAVERLYTEHSVIGVVRCDVCRLIYTSPRLRSPERIYWGDPDLYYAEARLIFEGKAAHHRDPNYLGELATIERYQQRGRLLDVGCNMGMLLRLAREGGWEAVGIEPSPALAGLAEKWGAKVYNCFLAEIPEEEHGSFDVVALSDVFEHIAQPLTFLKEASRLLKPPGVLYVKVPNARWNILKQRALSMLGYRPRQGLWDSYEHVVHYTEETLRRMLAATAPTPVSGTVFQLASRLSRLTLRLNTFTAVRRSTTAARWSSTPPTRGG